MKLILFEIFFFAFSGLSRPQNLHTARFVMEISSRGRGRSTFSLVTAEDTGFVKQQDLQIIFKSKATKSKGRRIVLKSKDQETLEKEFFVSRDTIFAQEFICVWDVPVVPYLKEAGEKGFFKPKHKWLIILNSNNSLNDVKQHMKDVAFYIDSEVIVSEFSNLHDRSVWTLHEIWKVGLGTDVFDNYLGSWSPLRGFEAFQLSNKYHRRRDLQGFHLRVATIMTMPYISLISDNTLQNFGSGYAVDIWNVLQQYLNFTYTAKNTLFGSLQKDGITWNGMVGMLQKGEADVAVAPLSIIKSRSIVIDFTIPVQIVSSRLYIRRPPLGATWLLYALPFDGALWICISFFVLFTGTWMWGINRAAEFFRCDVDKISLFQGIWAIFSGLVQQPALLNPKPISAKMLFIIGFLSTYIFYNVYSGILVSILTTLEARLPLRDFDDLCQKSDWDVGVRTNTALSDSLALSSKDDPMRCVWDRNVVKNPTKNLPNSNELALQHVLRGRYAFFANKEYIVYIMQRKMPLNETMHIVDTKTDFLVRGIGFGLQMGSPYTDIFNYYLKKMTLRGHLQRLRMKWWPDISSEPDSVYPSPGLQEVGSVFLLLCLGIVFAFLFLGLEKLFRMKLRTRAANIN